MRAPGFWWQKHSSLLAHALRPVSSIYGTIAGRRMRQAGERAALPIICIGNFTAGGAGKTPTALAVAEILDEAGESPAFLSRGYGGTLRGPIQVQTQHKALEVGDEPMLLAAMAPAIISVDRPAGARLAHEIGATVLIMDDGLQNPSLRKDCAIAVVDGAIGIGNGLPLPAGPLRAPMDAQWPAVDAVLIIGQGEAGEAVARQAERWGKRILKGRLAPDQMLTEKLQGQRVLAFAGIGRPEKFFNTLRACGAIVEETRAFPDHHPYNRSDLDKLRKIAEARGLQAVTTEKDFVRIASMNGPGVWGDLMVLPVRLELDDEMALRNFILRKISDRRLRRP
ncbi:tetraacyldisaccharide 4'-kinase [Microvirga guangxiensis]|uniref:Tetraacyldisaccharide 4'-kinase n=1 Tax=Microvirga guangxiensis TaxID=549386 RepID=A0A1G5JJQ3_9HYPH|nr:tetraacyldisaccharide 4'-kinase [Microvirga guangxiensis]SCY87948.1 lipid-A-disaccharide kinase [Microvirga guangxiensis]